MSPAPAVLDERWALWAAAAVAQRFTAQPDEVAALRKAIRDDLPDIDRAVRQFTGLGNDLEPASVGIVGRMGWVRANLSSLAGALEPLRDRLAGRPAARQVLGVQLGAVLGLMSSKVLGQFILPLSGGEGPLVVVGPNVLELADRHPRFATDLRRAVLLHEITHRVQMAAAPWMAQQLRTLIGDYLDKARVDADVLRRLPADAPRIIAEVRSTGTVKPLIDAVLTEEQSAIINHAQALMTLLEGHGNTVMFEAGGVLIGDIDEVRAALQARRNDVTSRLLAQVFGMEAKRRQYRDGEVFVRAVIDDAGMDGINRAFRAPDDLPRHDEIDDAQAWLRRVMS